MFGSAVDELIDEDADLILKFRFTAHVLRFATRFVRLVEKMLKGYLVRDHCSLKHVLNCRQLVKLEH